MGDTTQALVSARHAVRRTGRAGARPVLLVHGFGCDQTVWDAVRPALEVDHDVVSYDLLGAGSSDLSVYDDHRYAGLDGHVDDLLAVVRALDLRDVAAVGHSVGGSVALLASIADPDRFSALALIGTSPCYTREHDYDGGFTRADIHDLLRLLDDNVVTWSRTMAPLVMGNASRPHLSADLEARFLRLSPAVAAQLARVAFLSDIRDQLPAVSVPTLLLGAREDVVVPEAVLRWMHAHVPGSALRLLDATGHLPHLSAPEETVDAVRAFLRATAGRA